MNKPCRLCGKSVSYKKQKRYDYRCDPCSSKQAVEWAKRNPDKKRESNKRYLASPKGKSALYRKGRRRLEVHPNKKRANSAVQTALRNGSLIRKPCQVCGYRAEAHHDDYSKPLSVKWFCGKHHREIHSAMLKQREIA